MLPCQAGIVLMTPNARLSSKSASFARSAASPDALTLIYHSDICRPRRDEFHIGIDDAIILPTVVVALLARALFQVAFVIITVASTIVFALFRHVMLCLLLVAATAGDGTARLIRRLAD